jgi:hypothetical protein
MGHNIEMGSPMDHPNQDWLNLVQWFQRKRFKCESYWPINKKCFPLKPLWQLEPNFTEMVFRKSSIDNYNEMRIFVEVLLNIILVKFGSNWHSSFRADFFFGVKTK